MPVQAALNHSRRAVLLGLAAAPTAALAQGSSLPAPAATSGAGSNPAAPIAPPSPTPGMSLTAQRVPARLAAPNGPDSILHRLLPSAEATLSPGIVPETMLLRLKPTPDARLAIRNELGQPLALGLRGLRRTITGSALTGLAPASDGNLGFSATQSGSFLLTPVTPGLASEQIARGLTSLIVIEEDQPPAADHDLPLTVSDWRLNDSGQLDERFGDLQDRARMGRLGNRLVVNGRLAPGSMSVRPGARLRLRIANTAMARTVPLHVFGAQSRVIAIDSTPCEPFDPLKRNVTLAPGGRCEMMVDIPREPGGECRIEARFGQNIPLMTFKIEGAALPLHGPVLKLPDPGLPPAIRLQDALRANVTISGGLPREAPTDPEAVQRAIGDRRRIFRINDGSVAERPGEPQGRPLLKARRGNVVVLALRNQTAWPQVLSLGGHAFRLLHPFDDGWEPYFLDTLYLAPGSNAHIAFIADLSGAHALRSSIADHAESGVSTWIEVS
ncbi:SufI Putative multicopper oxidases [Rhabdaerophilaceae bacterium]